jgi:hypothetical protein
VIVRECLAGRRPAMAGEDSSVCDQDLHSVIEAPTEAIARGLIGEMLRRQVPQKVATAAWGILARRLMTGDFPITGPRP